MKCKAWAILFSCAITSISASAQTDTNFKAVLPAVVSQSQEGVLIVRMNSNHKKILELERLIQLPEVSEKSKARFREMLETTRKDTRQEALDMMKAFEDSYNFSEVLFMFDTASLLLKNGLKSGYFINRELQADTTIRLKTNQWLMIYFRHESPALFFLLDQQMNPVKRPFPLPKRPVLRSYKRNTYIPQDPLQKDATPVAFSSGFTLYMTHSKKKQLRFFSALIGTWNEDLTKAAIHW